LFLGGSADFKQSFELAESTKLNTTVEPGESFPESGNLWSNTVVDSENRDSEPVRFKSNGNIEASGHFFDADGPAFENDMVRGVPDGRDVKMTP
jgi:hypothetical protein